MPILLTDIECPVRTVEDDGAVCGVCQERLYYDGYSPIVHTLDECLDTIVRMLFDPDVARVMRETTHGGDK